MQTNVEFSSISDYFYREVQAMPYDSDIVKLGEQSRRATNIRLTETEFFDSLFDPFNMPSDEKKFMRFSETSKVVAPATEAQFWHSLKIDTKRQCISRSRYDFWQLLADLGGFYDGLMILVGLFVSPLSAISFMQDFSYDSMK